MHFWQICHWSDAVFFSLHSIRWHMISMYSITRELWTVNFEQLIKLVSAFFPDLLLNTTIPPQAPSYPTSKLIQMLCFAVSECDTTPWIEAFCPLQLLLSFYYFFSLGSRFVNSAQELWGLLVDIISKHVNGLVWRQEDVIGTQEGVLRSHAWPCSWCT